MIASCRKTSFDKKKNITNVPIHISTFYLFNTYDIIYRSVPGCRVIVDITVRFSLWRKDNASDYYYVQYNNARSVNKAQDENKWLEGEDCDDDAKYGQICEFVNERMHKWNKIFKTIRFFLLRRRHVLT